MIPINRVITIDEDDDDDGSDDIIVENVSTVIFFNNNSILDFTKFILTIFYREEIFINLCKRVI